MGQAVAWEIFGAGKGESLLTLITISLEIYLFIKNREGCMSRAASLILTAFVFATATYADSLSVASAYAPQTQSVSATPATSRTMMEPIADQYLKQPPLGKKEFRFHFRGQETIPVTLSRAADIVLELFDRNGRFITVLHNGAMPAGRNEIDLYWAKLSRGNYTVYMKERL
jgi:hypothetical protein